jgi:hypothetical protein
MNKEELMVSFFPAPETTLVILLGASEWPRYPELDASQAFSNAAKDVITYFLDPQGFHLPQENLLNLFDSDESNDSIDDSINQFLDKHIREKKREDSFTVKDVLFYFIGHGYISERNSDFHLAIRRTRQNNPSISSLSIRGLAKTLKEQSRFQRHIIVLDCCFAASAVNFYQGAGLTDIMSIRTNEAFEEKIVGNGFPGRGTTFICSSSSKVRSRFLQDGTSTMFTQAFLYALRTNRPSPEEKPLSLRFVHRLTIDFLIEKYGKEVPRPEVHSPDQSEGDVADVPFFPNFSAKFLQSSEGTSTNQQLTPTLLGESASALPTLSGKVHSPEMPVLSNSDSDVTQIPILPPQPPISAHLETLPYPSNKTILYSNALKARAEGELAEAIRLWQEIRDLDSEFQEKDILSFLETDLWQLVEHCARSGKWEEEIEALHALEKLPTKYKQEKRQNYRQERLKKLLRIAEQNQNYTKDYEDVVKQLLREGDTATAIQSSRFQEKDILSIDILSFLETDLWQLAEQYARTGKWEEEMRALHALEKLPKYQRKERSRAYYSSYQTLPHHKQG